VPTTFLPKALDEQRNFLGFEKASSSKDEDAFSLF
jgi:hypothetical protein